MLGIDDSGKKVAWPAVGFVSEFDFGECCRHVEVIRGKHKDDASGLWCVDVKVTDTIFHSGDTAEDVDYFTWEIEQYDSFIQQNQEDHDALAG
jgi:hypothetical protein